MVAGILIGVAALVTVAIVFNEPLNRALNKLTGETQEDKDKQTIRDERGALVNTGTFIFGEEFANPDGSISNTGKVQQATAIGILNPITGLFLQLQNLFNFSQQAELEKQAKQTGLNELGSSDIKPVAVTTKLGTTGKKGISVFN